VLETMKKYKMRIATNIGGGEEEGLSDVVAELKQFCKDNNVRFINSTDISNLREVCVIHFISVIIGFSLL
jgi:hypothetical protein